MSETGSSGTNDSFTFHEIMEEIVQSFDDPLVNHWWSNEHYNPLGIRPVKVSWIKEEDIFCEFEWAARIENWITKDTLRGFHRAYSRFKQKMIQNKLFATGRKGGPANDREPIDADIWRYLDILDWEDDEFLTTPGGERAIFFAVKFSREQQTQPT